MNAHALALNIVSGAFPPIAIEIEFGILWHNHCPAFRSWAMACAHETAVANPIVSEGV
jgi:hypothetical protein